jgi:hypothetical protein
MKDPFVLFWAVLILGSVAWYGFLVFYVGFKAGREIRQMIKTLEAGQPGRGGPPA